jgi:hypothetical protein
LSSRRPAHYPLNKKWGLTRQPVPGHRNKKPRPLNGHLADHPQFLFAHTLRPDRQHRHRYRPTSASRSRCVWPFHVEGDPGQKRSSSPKTWARRQLTLYVGAQSPGPETRRTGCLRRRGLSLSLHPRLLGPTTHHRRLLEAPRNLGRLVEGSSRRRSLGRPWLAGALLPISDQRRVVIRPFLPAEVADASHEINAAVGQSLAEIGRVHRRHHLVRTALDDAHRCVDPWQ